MPPYSVPWAPWGWLTLKFEGHMEPSRNSPHWTRYSFPPLGTSMISHISVPAETLLLLGPVSPTGLYALHRAGPSQVLPTLVMPECLRIQLAFSSCLLNMFVRVNEIWDLTAKTRNEIYWETRCFKCIMQSGKLERRHSPHQKKDQKALKRLLSFYQFSCENPPVFRFETV